MRTKLLMWIFLMLLPSFVVAKEDARIVNDRWHVGDGDRSSTSPYLYMDDEFVYIYSEKQLDGVYVAITDNQGHVFYTGMINISAGRDYAVSIEALPEGEYSIILMQGNKYVIGEFTK